MWAAWVHLTFFPDQQVGWALFAARTGLRAHQRKPVDIVYSSSGPVSCHVAAGLISRRAGLPWVADFRDPWLGNAFSELPVWQRPLQRWFDRWIIQHADRVVFASEGFLEGYRDRYPRAAHRFIAIPNGYDRNDFSPTVLAELADNRGAPEATNRASTEGRKFRLTYAGTVYGEHELEIFLQGLELLLGRRPELRDRLDVEFIGWLNLHNQRVAVRYGTNERLGSVVRYSGFLPHSETLERMIQADALFHVIADEPEKWRIASGKLSEYVGLDRQILAFVPEGEARTMLRELDWGIVADPTPEGVAEGIERALVTPVPSRRADREGRYDRVNLTRQLADVLDQVVAERAARRSS